MFLFERHGRGYHVDKKKLCQCSYCGDGFGKPMHYGLNVPKRWRDPNAWCVIKIWDRTYIRWTNDWLKWFRAAP